MIDNVDRLVIKWQGEGKGDAQAQAVLLASHLGLEPPVRVRQTGHDVYRSEEIVDTATGGAGMLVNVVDTNVSPKQKLLCLTVRKKWHANCWKRKSTWE